MVDLSFVGKQEGGDDPEEGGFARPVGTDKPENLPFPTSKEISFRAFTSPNDLDKCRTEMMDFAAMELFYEVYLTRHTDLEIAIIFHQHLHGIDKSHPFFLGLDDLWRKFRLGGDPIDCPFIFFVAPSCRESISTSAFCPILICESWVSLT